MAFSQFEIDLCKRRFRDQFTDAPYMRLVFTLPNGSTKIIETPHVYNIKVSNAFNSVGTASFEIMSVNGKFNYLIDPEWKGILNKKYHKIAIVEGYGTWRKITFNGYINRWEMSGDGNSEIVVKIECVNKIMDINNSIFKGMGLDPTKTIDELSKDIMGDVDMDRSQYDDDPALTFGDGVQMGGGVPSPTLEPYQPAPSGDYSGDSMNMPDGAVESQYATFRKVWKPLAKMNKVYGEDFYDDSHLAITKNGKALLAHYNAYLSDSESEQAKMTTTFTLYDMETLKDETVEYKLDKFVHYSGGLHRNSVVANQKSNKVAIVGTTRNRYSNSWYRIVELNFVSIIDIDSKENYALKNVGSVPNLQDSKFDIAFYDNEIWAIDPYKILKGTIDYKRKEVTWTVFKTLNQGLDDGWAWGASSYGVSRWNYSIAIRGAEIVVGVQYPYQSTVDFNNSLNKKYPNGRSFYYDFQSGELLREVPKSFTSYTTYNGYHINISADHYEIADLEYKDVWKTTTYNFPTDRPEFRFGKTYAVHNNKLYMFPSKRVKDELNTQNYQYYVFVTTLQFSDNGPEVSMDDPNVANYTSDMAIPDIGSMSMSDSLFSDARQDVSNDSNLSYPVNRYQPALPVLADVAADNGQSLYAMNDTGKVLVNYPTAKDIPDYIFESDVDVIGLKHGKSEEVFDRVIVYWGKHPNGGMVEQFRTKDVYPGQSSSVYKVMKPNMNEAQAKDYARRIIANGLSEEVEIASRAVLGLKIGDTIRVQDHRMLGTFIGVLMSQETDNTLENGYYGKYIILKFERETV